MEVFKHGTSISTFAETTPDVITGETVSHAERIRQIVEEIKLADAVGLIFMVLANITVRLCSIASAVVLAAAATQTKQIRLTSAVTVLSSDDQYVFPAIRHTGRLSNGRAEIMAGVGHLLNRSHCLGYLRTMMRCMKKARPFIKYSRNEIVLTGHFRPSIPGRGIYPSLCTRKVTNLGGKWWTPHQFVHNIRLVVSTRHYRW